MGVEIANALHVTNRAAWRAWLERHHQSETEVWLVFFKAHTGRPRVAYEDAVEEALCFGWVDSLVKRLDDDRYVQKFTPRKPGSTWSESNRKRIAKLIREGRMTPAGVAKVTFPLPEGIEQQSPERPRHEPELPPDLLRVLKDNEPAWKTFRGLAPSYRRNYLGWIMDAKKDETRRRRLAEALSLLAEGKKLGLK
ncbi:MAG: YdeI/OmpD-associated family protein [Acidobacteriia bacterium]|nr:YdeI/OmpD-associated family protein [Terriglobia bacterium]